MSETIECHGLDTPERVHFYEQDFYVLSNFSSFTLWWQGLRFDTSEAAYHWEKFAPRLCAILNFVINVDCPCDPSAPSNHPSAGWRSRCITPHLFCSQDNVRLV